MFECDNHKIIITKTKAIITTINGFQHLENYKNAIKSIINRIITNDDTVVYSLGFNVNTIDKDIEICDIDNKYKHLFIESNIKEKINKDNDNLKGYELVSTYSSYNKIDKINELTLFCQKRIKLYLSYYESYRAIIKKDVTIENSCDKMLFIDRFKSLITYLLNSSLKFNV